MNKTISLFCAKLLLPHPSNAHFFDVSERKKIDFRPTFFDEHRLKSPKFRLKYAQTSPESCEHPSPSPKRPSISGKQATKKPASRSKIAEQGRLL